MPADEDGISAE
jgi:hypothetical protein